MPLGGNDFRSQPISLVLDAAMSDVKAMIYVSADEAQPESETSGDSYFNLC